MIIKNKRYNFSYDEPYIKIKEGNNGSLPLGDNLDITNNATISRTGNSTVINKNGYLQNIAANYPRFEYDCKTYKFKGLLIEREATNTFLNSNTLGTPTLNNTTSNIITSNTPYGTLGSIREIIPNTNNTNHSIYWTSGFSITANTWCTISFFAKKRSSNDLNSICLLTTINSVNDYQVFNLGSSTKSFGIGSHTTKAWTYGNAKIEEYKDGWYRCSVTFKSSIVPTNFHVWLRNKNDLDLYVGDVNTGCYFFGMQVENIDGTLNGTNVSSTSYIPTTSSAITRSKDILKLNLNKNVNSLNVYNYNNFSIMCECRLKDMLNSYNSLYTLSENISMTTNYNAQRAIQPLRKNLNGTLLSRWNKFENTAEKWVENTNSELKNIFYETKYLTYINSETVNVLDYNLNKWITTRKYDNYIINYLTMNLVDNYSTLYLKKLYIWNKKINDKRYLF